jgi:hypothetical protein
MKYRSTLFLTAAVIVAGVVAYSLSRKPTSDELDVLRRHLLPDLIVDAVNGLTLESVAGKTACVRNPGQGSGWRIQEPVQARADAKSIEGILVELAEAEAIGTGRGMAADSPGSAGHGFDAPLATVTISRSSGPATILRFGAEVPFAGRVYARVDEGAVVTVPHALLDRVSVALVDLRSKNLAPRVPFAKIRGLDIVQAPADATGELRISLRRVGSRWEFHAPFRDLADSDAIRDYVDRIYNHRVEAGGFMADDPDGARRYGLGTPALQVVVEGPGTTQALAFGPGPTGGQPGYFATLAGDNSVMRVPGQLFEDLHKQAGHLRETSLVDFIVGKVEQVEVRGPGTEFALRKGGDGWSVGGHSPEPADPRIVATFLQSMKGVQIERFMPDAPDMPGEYGLGEPERFSISLFGGHGELVAEVVLGASDGHGSRYAMRPPYPSVFTVPARSGLEPALQGTLAFVERTLLAEDPAAARAISSRHGETHVDVQLDPGTRLWRVVGPARGAADQAAVRAFLDRLSDLEVDSFVTDEPADLARFGLEQPTRTVTVVYDVGADAGVRQHVIELGTTARGDGASRYARLDASKRIAVMGGPALADLMAEPGSRKVSNAARIEAILMRKSGNELAFAFDSATREWHNAQGSALDDRTMRSVSRVARLLSNFEAERIVAYRQHPAEAYGFDLPFMQIEFDEPTAKGKRIIIGAENAEGGRYARGVVTPYVLLLRPEDVGVLSAAFQNAG